MSSPFYWSSHFLCLRFMSIFFIFVMGFSQGYYVLFQVKKSTYIPSLLLFNGFIDLTIYSELRRGCGGRWRSPYAKSSRIYPWDILDVLGWIFFFHNLIFIYESSFFLSQTLFRRRWFHLGGCSKYEPRINRSEYSWQCTMRLSIALRIWNIWKCKGLVFAQFWSNIHQSSSNWS